MARLYADELPEHRTLHVALFAGPTACRANGRGGALLRSRAVTSLTDIEQRHLHGARHPGRHLGEGQGKLDANGLALPGR